jgi:hypothetical protein
VRREAKSETEKRKNQGKGDAYLTHGCGFADGREDLRFPIDGGILFLSFGILSYFLGELFLVCFLLWRSAVC